MSWTAHYQFMKANDTKISDKKPVSIFYYFYKPVIKRLFMGNVTQYNYFLHFTELLNKIHMTFFAK